MLFFWCSFMYPRRFCTTRSLQYCRASFQLNPSGVDLQFLRCWQGLVPRMFLLEPSLMCLQYRESCTFTSPYTLSNPSPYALTVVLEKQLNYVAPWCDCTLLSHMVGKPEKLMSEGKMMEDKERGKPVCTIKRNGEDKTKTHRRK